MACRHRPQVSLATLPAPLPRQLLFDLLLYFLVVARGVAEVVQQFQDAALSPVHAPQDYCGYSYR